MASDDRLQGAGCLALPSTLWAHNARAQSVSQEKAVELTVPPLPDTICFSNKSARDGCAAAVHRV